MYSIENNFSIHRVQLSACAADNERFFFQVISKIESMVNKTIIDDYGKDGKKKLTEAINKAQQEVRHLSLSRVVLQNIVNIGKWL